MLVSNRLTFISMVLLTVWDSWFISVYTHYHKAKDVLKWIGYLIQTMAVANNHAGNESEDYVE